MVLPLIRPGVGKADSDKHTNLLRTGMNFVRESLKVQVVERMEKHL
jgi:hypothetical protein